MELPLGVQGFFDPGTTSTRVSIAGSLGKHHGIGPHVTR